MSLFPQLNHMCKSLAYTHFLQSYLSPPPLQSQEKQNKAQTYAHKELWPLALKRHLP